jgi:hypothetical protein
MSDTMMDAYDKLPERPYEDYEDYENEEMPQPQPEQGTSADSPDANATAADATDMNEEEQGNYVDNSLPIQDQGVSSPAADAIDMDEEEQGTSQGTSFKDEIPQTESENQGNIANNSLEQAMDVVLNYLSDKIAEKISSVPPSQPQNAFESIRQAAHTMSATQGGRKRHSKTKKHKRRV